MTKKIEYIGRKPDYKDVIYGTGLTFVPGQVRELPLALAQKFLRHEDVFREAVVPDAQKEQDEQKTATETTVTNAQQGQITTETKTEVDDTAAVLAAAKKEEDALAQIEQERAGLLDQVRSMTKPELTTLAKDRWDQELHKNLSLENARAKVIQFVDQFGAA